MLGGVWALLATAIDVLCSRKNEALRLMLFGLSAAMLVDVGRGAVYNSVCGIWYGSILIFLYFFLAKAISGWIEGRKTRQSN